MAPFCRVHLLTFGELYGTDCVREIVGVRCSSSIFECAQIASFRIPATAMAGMNTPPKYGIAASDEEDEV